MTQQQIEKQINDEMQEFFNSPFTSKLPLDIIETFKKAIWVCPFGQLHVEKVKELMGKKPKELNFVEVGVIVNKIMEAPFEKLYTNLNVALAKHEILEKVVIEFNHAKRNKEVELSQRKQTLYALANPNGQRPSNILAKA